MVRDPAIIHTIKPCSLLSSTLHGADREITD